MTMTVTHIEEVAAHAVAPDTGPHLDPTLARALQGAREAMDRAQAVMHDPHHADIATPEAVREAMAAVDELRAVMRHYDDMPNPMLDAIDGALHEVQAGITLMHTEPVGPGLVDRVGVHFDAARAQLGDLLDPPHTRAGIEVLDPFVPPANPNTPHIMGAGTEVVDPLVPPTDPDTPHIMAAGNGNPGIVPPFAGGDKVRRHIVDDRGNTGIVPPWMQH